MTTSPVYSVGTAMPSVVRKQSPANVYLLTDIDDPLTVEAMLWYYAGRASTLPDQCWPWRGQTNGRDRGKIILRIKGQWKWVMAHRMAFLFAYGYLPAPPLVVRHLCGNKICCNPVHLACGTAQENSQDTRRHGTLRGENHPRASITEAEVAEIRRLRAQGIIERELGRMFAMPRKTIHDIVKGNTWTHLPGGDGSDRTARGERQGGAKLSAQHVREILQLRKQGMTQRAVAQRFGVCRSTISYIENGKNWRHLTIQMAEPT